MISLSSTYEDISNKAMAQIMKAVDDLGISPTSQARVSVVEAHATADDPLAQIQRRSAALRAVKW